jgi:hypothetical protein
MAASAFGQKVCRNPAMPFHKRKKGYNSFPRIKRRPSGNAALYQVKGAKATPERFLLVWGADR